jgi:hypothetical protein
MSLLLMNAMNSHIAAAVMLGPTYFNAKASLSSMVSATILLFALEIKNILSTPIAKIKKGATSALIKDKPKNLFKFTYAQVRRNS